MEIIEVRDLWKSYAGRPVVQGIDLSVAEGEIFGILGPNGAGKTTAVEMIGGLRTRDRGEVRVAGFDPAAEDRDLRELLGMQLQESRQPAKITVREAIDLYRTLLSSAARDRRTAGALRVDGSIGHPLRAPVRRTAAAVVGGLGAGRQPADRDPGRVDHRP